MKAIRKEPGCAPELIDIDNTLKACRPRSAATSKP